MRHRVLFAVYALVLLGALIITPAPQLSAHEYHPADYPYPHIHSLVRDPADPQHVYALGNPEFYESMDGGRSWQARGGGVPTAHYARLVFEPHSGDLFAYTPGIAGLHRSGDGGWSWPMQTDRLLRDLVVFNQRGAVRLLAIAHDLRLIASDDHGHTWQERAAPWAGAGDARLIQRADPAGTLIAVGGGSTYRSTDHGATWTTGGAWPADLTPVRLFAASDTGDVFAIAHRGAYDPRPVGNTLLRSMDAGQSWQLTPLNDTWAAVAASGSRVVAATWHGDVWYHDGGAWDAASAWERWPLALVQPIDLRGDVNPTPTVTDLLPAGDGSLLASTVLGMYRADRAGLPLSLRSRGLIPTAALPTAPLDRSMEHGGNDHFDQTDHMLGGAFRAAWQRLGGVQTLGYPLTEPYLERDRDSGLDEQTQMFERGRLVLHADGTVTAARILADVQPITSPARPQLECRFFAATHHNVCDALLQRWYQLGAEHWLGLPLDDAALVDGVRVQHFERGRLEQHPSGTIEIGLVGREEAQRRGWLP